MANEPTFRNDRPSHLDEIADLEIALVQASLHLSSVERLLRGALGSVGKVEFADVPLAVLSPLNDCTTRNDLARHVLREIAKELKQRSLPFRP